MYNPHFWLTSHHKIKKEMEIKGKVVVVLPQQSGTSAAGNQWKKQEFVIETQEQFPKKICMTLFGDRVDQYPVAVNDEIVANIDIESREYNGRWYTNINAWKVEKATAQSAPAPAPMPTFEPQPESDDLPF